MLIKIITFVFWFLIMSSLMTYSFELINEPNTIANWIGFIILVIGLIVSIKTVCFTKLFEKKK